MTIESTHTLPPLHVCAVSARPEGLSDLERFLRESGCSPILTTPARLPVEIEWEAFDLVLIDGEADGSLPALPPRRVRRLLATCAAGDADNPAVLRAALRAGASDVLPRDPAHPGWARVLAEARAPCPGATLRFLDPGSRVERFFRLEHDAIGIGRDPSNDLVLALPFVSRLHARIERCGGRYRLIDLGSRLGTLVNDRKVHESMLAEGDRIRIGGEHGPILTFTAITLPESTLILDGMAPIDQNPINQEVQDIAALLESFLSLDSDLLMEEVLDIVLDRTIAFVQADRGMILLRPWQDGTALRVAAEDLKLGTLRDRQRRPLPEADLDVDFRIVHEVLRVGRGVVHEAAVDPGGGDTRTAVAPVRSSMCVPLKVRGKSRGDAEAGGPAIIGILYLDSASRSRPYSPLTLNTLEVLAAEAAMAIHTTRLYEESLERRRVEEEMSIAREIQRGIFQDIDLADGVWRIRGSTSPCQEVGGDFLSALRPGGARPAIVIGDVSGKGMPAALFSTMLEGFFAGLEDLHAESPDLTNAAAKLNAFVLGKSHLRKFVTAIFGRFEPDGSFVHINAGHNPAIIRRRDGTLEELAVGGTILGMFDDAAFRPAIARIESGDCVVFYSDGLTDARDRNGRAFGLERLRSLLAESPAASEGDEAETAAARIHDGILGALRAYLRGAAPRDDITLLVVTRM